MPSGSSAWQGSSAISIDAARFLALRPRFRNFLRRTGGGMAQAARANFGTNPGPVAMRALSRSLTRPTLNES